MLFMCRTIAIGWALKTTYGNEAFVYDQQVSTNPNLSHVFSAGNSGKLEPPSGTYLNMKFANLSGNFKQAKNVLEVNAVDSTLTVNALNSRGVAFDGRLKRELTAFGQDGTSRWDFLLLNDQAEGGAKNLLVWEAALDQTGDLFLQLNNNDWQLIQLAVDLGNYFYLVLSGYLF